MSQFKSSEPQYRKFRRKFLLISIPISTLIVAGILMVDLSHASGKPPISLIFHLGFLACLTGIFVYVIYGSLQAVHRTMMSYILTISESGVSQQSDATPLSVSPAAIREIRKTRSGGFQVCGQTVTIGIPRWVDDMNKVEEQLKALAPITTNPKADRRDSLQVFCVTAGLVLFIICVLWSSYWIFEVIKCMLTVGFLGLWLYLFRTKDKNPTQGARMMSRIVIFLMVGTLILTIVKLLLF